MRVFPAWAALLSLASHMAAAPPLTTIQDVLYKADGTPFHGLAIIEWQGFEASDLSNIATHSLTVPIVKGYLRVQLVPTTTSAGGAYYTVRYNSDGKVQFSEKWSVPPSAEPLRVRAVRVATGPGGGTIPPPDTVVSIADVTGLENELAVRPVKGAGYQPSRAAVINGDGDLEAANGEPADCVRVDGSSGPCGTGGGGGTMAFADAETPTGTADGVNAAFTLSRTPVPASSLLLYRNGILQKQGLDYTLSSAAITFAAASLPQTGDLLLASYRVAEAGGSTLPAALCVAAGVATASTSDTELASCAIAAGVLRPGDRLAIRLTFSHEGAAQVFTVRAAWGNATLFETSAPAAETVFSATIEGTVQNEGAWFDYQTRGAVSQPASGAISSSDPGLAGVNVRVWGRMASGGTETVTVRNITVIRYPAAE